MTTVNNKGPALLEYHIDKAVQAFSTTRLHGVSIGDYAAFNINPFCGDNPSHVAHNRLLLAEELGLSEGRIILPHQTHSANVLCIGSTLPNAQLLDGVDAVVTNEKKLCIGVSTADCIPILLYDPLTGVIAAIHAGWRGTIERIVTKTIDVIKNVYAVNPTNLKAVVGPGISVDAFEVGDEVYGVFKQKQFDMNAIAKRYTTTEGREKWHIDLPLANSLLLLETGIRESNIQNVNICTYKSHDRFFSARRLGINSGRIYTAIFKL